MDWISVNGGAVPWVTPALMAGRISHKDGVLRQGSLYIECAPPNLATGPVLLRVVRDPVLNGLLSLQWVPSVGLVFIATQGKSILHIHLELDDVPDRLALHLDWNEEDGWSRLTAVAPEGSTFVSQTVQNTPRIHLSDAYLLAKGPQTLTGSTVTGTALSSSIAPIGPWATVAPETLVETPHGPVQIQALKPGDTVRCLGGDVHPVLHVVRQTLPAFGDWRTELLPAKDAPLRVARGQKLVLTGEDIAGALGHSAVRASVGQFPDSWRQPQENQDAGGVAPYAQIVLPEAAAFLAHGHAVESLSFAALKRCWPRFALGPLGSCKWHRLPTHGPSAYPMAFRANLARLTQVGAARA